MYYNTMQYKYILVLMKLRQPSLLGFWDHNSLQVMC